MYMYMYMYMYMQVTSPIKTHTQRKVFTKDILKLMHAHVHVLYMYRILKRIA